MVDTNAQPSPMRSPKNNLDDSFNRALGREEFKDRQLEDFEISNQFKGFKTKTMFNEYYQSNF